MEYDKISENMDRFLESYKQMTAKYLGTTEGSEANAVWLDMYKTWVDVAAKAVENPEEFQKKQAEVFADYMKIWSNACARYMGGESKPIYQAEAKDRRFKDSAWNNDIMFDFLKQSYLFTTKWMQEFISGIKGVDERTKKKLEFSMPP